MMDREMACRLFNLITEGHPVGVDAEGGVVSGNTELGTVLRVLGKPSHVRRVRIADGSTRRTILPNGAPYNDPYDWDTKDAAAFLREWAAALDPPVRTGGGPNDFRKLPVVIQAVQLRWDTWQEMCEHAGVGKLSEGKPEGFWPDGEGTGRIGMHIPTLEGVMEATEGDWIIRGVKGELYPCKPDIFDSTYVKA